LLDAQIGHRDSTSFGSSHRPVLARKTVADALLHPALLVLGIGADGKKEIVELCLAVSESLAEWERFFAYLNRRGPPATFTR